MLGAVLYIIIKSIQFTQEQAHKKQLKISFYIQYYSNIKKNTDIRQDCSDTGDGIVILKVINIGFSGMSDFR